MAYNFVDEHDLNRVEEKIAQASKKLEELRAAMKSRTPQKLFLKSFATAEWQAEQLVLGLDACVDNISPGDKKLAKITETASRIHARSAKNSAARKRKNGKN